MFMLLDLDILQLRHINQHNDTNNSDNICQSSYLLAPLAGPYTQCSYYTALRGVQ